MKKYASILILFFLVFNQNIFAQEELPLLVVQDSIKTETIDPLSPSKAAFYSAILPGLGQAYNKKYWKIPIVYAALGTGVGIYAWNDRNYNKYRDEYKRRLVGNPSTDGVLSQLTDSQLISAQRQFQKNRDLSLIVTVGIYILNIVEANVNAHLMQFNVNENLSVKPDMFQNDFNQRQNLGLTLNYSF
ncbi:hypothetical protein GV828_04785 [Flavobacterium sp. NST-5]|uniref:DUF5683 domain-containing protein n=1 Tax=Flavobacterium ichthyis TaxID=2698827 RepID=A0ABW9ZBP2_9FLAO|nr:DUF5683 domain-containing protein [Flavobacterium ichthyis]NBL64515.1 hypothetical protein [Flavobacterium ichthyis]